MTAELAGRRMVVDQLRGLAQTDPAYRPELAMALVELADDLQGDGSLPEALTCVREAKQIYQGRIRDGHTDQMSLALCLNHEANWLAATGDARARQLFAEEAALYMALVAMVPIDRLGALTPILQRVFDVNIANQRFVSAEGAARACIELARRAVPQDPDAEIFLASSYTSLAYSLMLQNRLPAAMEAATRSAEIARRVAERHHPEDTGTVLQVSLTLVAQLADTCGRRKVAKEARAEMRARGFVGL